VVIRQHNLPPRTTSIYTARASQQAPAAPGSAESDAAFQGHTPVSFGPVGGQCPCGHGYAIIHTLHTVYTGKPHALIFGSRSFRPQNDKPCILPGRTNMPTTQADAPQAQGGADG